MKDYSVAQIKKGFKTPIQQFPREGSKIRELFDILNAYKGQVVDISDCADNLKNVDMRIRQLIVFYGMDIVHVGKNRWRFVGEYIGPAYVSYADGKPLLIKIKKKNDQGTV